MEYVIVKFSESRKVYIDDKPSGDTNETLLVENGHHAFRIEGNPEVKNLMIEDSTNDYPEVIDFSPLENQEEGQS